jgi:hypothetical protein
VITPQQATREDRINPGAKRSEGETYQKTGAEDVTAELLPVGATTNGCVEGWKVSSTHQQSLVHAEVSFLLLPLPSGAANGTMERKRSLTHVSPSQ